jgi:hypothetical protein
VVVCRAVARICFGHSLHGRRYSVLLRIRRENLYVVGGVDTRAGRLHASPDANLVFCPFRDVRVQLQVEDRGLDYVIFTSSDGGSLAAASGMEEDDEADEGGRRKRRPTHGHTASQPYYI